ncbi:LysE family transporter [Methanobacterium petrolearium]|uniref:LysE family transporter n=1 Tax=Methanobacterium petrolearium TaxID=710190 RepID=UPI001AE40FCD|nr:LysE family transporter [Methanobacterium petrolearium]MBP1944890.1 threonine/homoserine/homoserine lactone efflux protein [Methanobacterium petrolearium]BDZ70196.1 lysine transporter LysE [Methanobacterium petrolearium]
MWIEVLLFAVASFWVGLSGAMVPGPMLTVTISDSLKKGYKAGPLIVLGHYIAEITLMILLVLGLGWAIGSKTATMIIGGFGGLMLIYIGYVIAKSPVPSKIPGEEESTEKRGSIISGIITSVTNPYFYLWWATVGWAFMLKGIELAGVIGVLSFLVGHWGADLTWYSLVSFFTSKGRHVLPGKRYKIMMIVCGVFLVLLGVYFIYSTLIA